MPKHAFSQKFIRQYKGLTPWLKVKVDKQIAFLVANLYHSSLRAKKCDEANRRRSAPQLLDGAPNHALQATTKSGPLVEYAE